MRAGDSPTSVRSAKGKARSPIQRTHPGKWASNSQPRVASPCLLSTFEVRLPIWVAGNLQHSAWIRTERRSA